MGNNEDIQNKVHEELDYIFSDSNESATTKEISQLKYLDRVAKEALRLYPSAPGFLRKLSEDVKIGKCKFYHLSFIVVIFYLILCKFYHCTFISDYILLFVKKLFVKIYLFFFFKFFIQMITSFQKVALWL